MGKHNPHDAGWTIICQNKPVAVLDFTGYDWPFFLFSLTVRDATVSREEYLTYEKMKQNGVCLVNRRDATVVLKDNFIMNPYDTDDSHTCSKVVIRDFSPYC